MEILRERRRERQRRIKLAREFVEEVADSIGSLTAVVIGSTSRGDFNAWSDIDVVIISDVFNANPLKRFDSLIPFIKPGIEPIPLRTVDVYRLAEKKAPVVKEIVEGIVIRDDLGIIKKLKIFLKE
ncbi:MAG: nucleotidyltransferase domain-containing protein [Candidatus Baldrarchaeia archaeon]